MKSAKFTKSNRHLLWISSFLFSGLFSAQAWAASTEIVVASPTNNSVVTSPVQIQATVSQCGGKATTAFGFSVDTSASMTWGSATEIDTSDSSISLGTHVLHFKAWAKSILCPVIDYNITVTSSSESTGLPIPSNAVVDSHRELLSNWKWNHDPGTPGSSSGTSSLVSSPTRSGQSREFSMQYSDAGGEIYSASWADDNAATHFVYENWVLLSNPAQVANLEMDMNQVMANGQTVIYAFQCSGYSKTWEYTINSGTPTKPKVSWVPSNVSCDPQQWSANTWHHVQIAYSRDAEGNVTYESVFFDGVTSALKNAYGNSAFALGWGQVLLTNFQIDGLGSSGSSTLYSNGLNIYRW
jgi:hypothetical protein